MEQRLGRKLMGLMQRQRLINLTMKENIVSKEGVKVPDIEEKLEMKGNNFDGKKVELASSLDGTVDTIYKPKTQQELDQIEAEEYQGPPTLLERVMESDLLIKAGSVGATVLIATGAGPVLFPTEAKAETRMVSPSGMPSQAALEGYSVDTPSAETKNEAKIATPAPDMSEPTGAPTPSAEDAEYTATIAALESLGYSTEHYAERQRKINEYKRQLVEYAGENINLEACANGAYAIETSGFFGDPSYTNPEKTVLGNYATVDEMFYFYKNSKFEKGSNLRAIYRKDENGKKTQEVGFWSAVNPKIKTLSANEISGVIDEWEDITPGFLKVMNDNGAWFIFQSQAGNNETQMMKFNDILIYLNYNGKPRDFLRAGLPIEQNGVRCKALGGEFSAENMDGLLKARFALLGCENVLSNVDEKYVDFLNWWSTNYLQTEIADYTSESLGNRTLSYVNSLIDNAISKNLITLLGSKSLAEIDTANTMAKAD